MNDEYEQSQRRINEMDPVVYHNIAGFIEGLAYVQAQDPTVDDRPIKVDFPPELQGMDRVISITVQQFVDVWRDIDEGGILDFRFTAEQPTWAGAGCKTPYYLKINLASTEGHRGIPEEWHDLLAPVKWLTIEQAQEVLDKTKPS